MSSIKKLRKAKDQIKSRDALRDHVLTLAQSLLSEDRLEEALVEFEELGELSKGSNLDIEAFSYRKSGEILEKLGNYDGAYLKLQKYHDVSVIQPTELQRALTTLGGHFLSKSEFQVCDLDSRYTLDSPEIIKDLCKADDYCRRAEDAIKDTFIPDKEKEEMRCAIYANQFKIYYFRKRYESSNYYFDKAERIMKENKFNDRLSNLYESRSLLERKWGRLELALTHIDKAISVSGSSQAKELLKYKGLVLIDMRSFNKAQLVLVDAYKSANSQHRDSLVFLLKTIFRIIKIMDEDDYQDEVKKLEKLGDLCADMEAYHAAVWFYDTAINRLDPESGESKSILSGLFTSLAVTYKDLMMFNLASEFYIKELELSKEVPEESFKTLMALTITTELEGKPYRSVKELFMEARSLSKQMDDVIKELYCLNEFLQFNERRGEDDPELGLIKSEFEKLKADHGLSAEDIVLDEEHEVDENTDDDEEFDVDDFIYKIDCTHKRAKRKVSLKKDMKGETELHRKVKNPGNKREVARLIDQSVFVDIEDNAKYTPLHEACNHGHLEYVEMLVSAGADVNKISETGTSPLISAAVNGHIDVMEYLLDQGAKPYHQDLDGWSCFDYFKESNVDHEDKSYLKLYSRLSRAIKTKVATGLRLEPKKEGSSSALIVVRSDDSDDDEGHRTSNDRRYASLKSMKVNEKITKYTERNGSLRNELPHREDKTTCSSKAASDYRRTIASLGSSGATTSYVVQTPINSVKSKAEKIYSKGVISEKEYNFVNDLEADDWLDEDIPSSRRRKNKTYHDEPLSKKIRRRSKDENSPPLNRNIISSNHNSDSISEPKSSLSSSTPRRTIQQLIKPISNTPKTIISKRSSLKAEGIHRVKVKVYEKVFLIPIVNQKQNVEWLANEASKRYHSATGRRLLLKLSTEDGAEVYPEDPLASIIDPNTDHFIATITSLNSSVSLEKFYVKRCKELNRNQHKPLLNALTSAIKSGIFSLPEKIPFDLSDMEPMLETLNYGLSSRLKELSIPYNSLSNINFQSTLFSLTGLKRLNLSRCGLLSHHFTDSLPQLPSLEDLDLSYNEIGDEVMMKILTTFDSLNILNLKRCGLTKDFELPFSQRKIKKLNISGNLLLRHGIEKLLRSLNPSQLNSLDISHCGSFDSLEKIIVMLYEGSSDDELLLEHLDASGLDLKSTISNFDVFDRIPRLKSLKISDNMNLTMPELRKLLEGLYIRNIPLEQFEACDIFSLFSHEDPDENQRLVKIFKRLVSNHNLICFRLHLDEEDDLHSLIQDLSNIWKDVHGTHSDVQFENQVLSFGHPIYP